MRNFLKAAVAAAALGGASLAAVQPAEAHDAGTAVFAGILGLGLGAAIASSSHHHDGYYRSGYQQPYYGGGYAPGYDVRYDRGDYGRGYYQGGYGRNGYDRGGYDRGDHGWDRDRDGRDWRR